VSKTPRSYSILPSFSASQLVGEIIIKLDRDGSLKLFVVADSDDAERHLLSVIRESIVVGDIWELL